jgi:hypothetical protein
MHLADIKCYLSGDQLKNQDRADSVRFQCIIHPPSTLIIWPVRKSLS